MPSFEHARAICRDLFTWYNDAYHHSGLSYLTPADVHHGRAATILEVRRCGRLAAYIAHPERFVNGPPCPDETLPTAVWVNPALNTTRQDAPGTSQVVHDVLGAERLWVLFTQGRAGQQTSIPSPRSSATPANSAFHSVTCPAVFHFNATVFGRSNPHRRTSF